MKEILIKQVKFENWANTELLNSLKKASPLDPRALELFSHLLSSGSMWLNRVRSEPIVSKLFQERSLEECEALLTENTAQWLNYLEHAGNEELTRIIEFIFPLDGSKKRISVQDAILHIVHHSSYHRGQIVLKLKGSIEKLPLVTYIIYATENVGP